MMLGLAPGDTVVLVVAGSWGVGDVDETVAAIAREERFTTIVVCGEDEPLQRKLLSAQQDLKNDVVRICN